MHQPAGVYGSHSYPKVLVKTDVNPYFDAGYLKEGVGVRMQPLAAHPSTLGAK
jgi:hypothetical protein